MSWFAQDDAAACNVSAALAVSRSAGGNVTCSVWHGVCGPALQGLEVELLDHGEDLARLLGDLIMTAGQVLGQPDVTGAGSKPR